MKTNIRKTFPAALAAVVLWAILTFTRKAFLFKTCDLSLFLFDWTFLWDSFKIPGGFLSWTGSFFTQFLYFPWLGALIWVILLFSVGILTVRIFRLPSDKTALAVIPVALLIIANMSLGYGIFIMRSQDYFFAPTLGYLFMLAVMAASWHAPKCWLKFVILAVSAFAGYILAGIFALAGVAAAGIGLAAGPEKDGHDESHTLWTRFAFPALSAILCVVTPILLYGLFTRYRLTDSWNMGLPSVSHDEWTVWVRLPLWLIMGFAVVMAIMRSIISRSEAPRKRVHVTNAVLTTVAIGAIVLFWYKDENFKTELEMSIATDHCEWKQVTDIFHKASMRHIDKEKKLYEKRQKELAGVQDKATYDLILEEYDDCFFQPTRLMVLLRDLALIRQGKEFEQAFAMRDGARQQKSRTQVAMVIQAGRQLYLNYGLINQEYRWCLEDQVEHGWCFGTLKYMAMHAIIMNETEFASRYLDKLDKTLFYRGWSRSQRKLSEDSLAMSQALPYSDILPLMSFSDRMSNDRVKIETYLMSHFANDRDSMATHQFDSAALFWAMRTQDIDMFWKALAQYIETAPDLNLPKSVQEAVILYSNLEQEDMGIPVEKSVIDSFSSFRNYSQKSQFRSEKEAMFPLWLNFGNTFYYYYYFIRGLKTF